MQEKTLCSPYRLHAYNDIRRLRTVTWVSDDVETSAAKTPNNSVSNGMFISNS